MARILTGAVETASLEAQVAPVLFAELDAASGLHRFSTADRTLSFAGLSFAGIGDFGKLSPLGEPSDLSVQGITIALSGIPSTYVDLALAEIIQGRPARVWLGFLDATSALIADPVLLFRGRMDVMDIRLGETAEVAISIENRLADWDRPRMRRYTDADQRAVFGADKGFEFVSQSAERELRWGSS